MMISMIMAVVRMVPSPTARSIVSETRRSQAAKREGCNHAKRGGLGRRSEAGVDGSDDDEEDEQRRDQARQNAKAAGPAGLDRYPAFAAVNATGQEHDQHEQGRQQKAGNEACKVEARDRAVGQQSVQDEIDRGRDQNAERAAGRDGAEKQRLVVLALLDLREARPCRSLRRWRRLSQRSPRTWRRRRCWRASGRPAARTAIGRWHCRPARQYPRAAGSRPASRTSGMAIRMYSLDEFQMISPIARCSGIEA